MQISQSLLTTQQILYLLLSQIRLSLFKINLNSSKKILCLCSANLQIYKQRSIVLLLIARKLISSKTNLQRPSPTPTFKLIILVTLIYIRQMELGILVVVKKYSFEMFISLQTEFETLYKLRIKTISKPTFCLIFVEQYSHSIQLSS